jgi:hypothetical protein
VLSASKVKNIEEIRKDMKNLNKQIGLIYCVVLILCFLLLLRFVLAFCIALGMKKARDIKESHDIRAGINGQLFNSSLLQGWAYQRLGILKG